MNPFNALSDIATNMVATMRKPMTPLNTVYFSQANVDRVQRLLRDAIKAETGLSIDRQNQDDVLAFMRYTYINNAMNPYGNIETQVNKMNQQVVAKMLPQVRDGVSSYILYLRDASTLYVPNNLPVNTSVAGDRLPINNRIGMGGLY
jgi:hypothetical protein